MSEREDLTLREPSAPDAELDAAAATTGTSVLRGGLWSTGTRVLSQVTTLVLSIAAARFLGADGLGRQSYIAFVQASLVLVLTAGITSAVARQVSDLLGRGRPGAVRSLLRWAWRLELVAAVAGGAILIAAGLGGADPESAWVLAGVGCTAAVAASIPGALLAGAQRWRDATVVGLVAVLVVTPTTIVVLALGGGVVGMFAVEAAVGVAGMVATGWLALRWTAKLPDEPQPERLSGPVLRYAGVTTLLVLLEVVIWKRSEFFFLQHYSNDTQIAFYSVSFAAVAALMMVPEAANIATAPAFATLHGAGEHGRIQSGYSRSLRLLVVVSLPLTTLSFALGPDALRVLYGPEFEDAAPVLRVMLVLLPFIALSTVTGAVLMALDRLWAFVAISAVGAAVIVGLNFALVPSYDAIGAAIANTVGQAALTLPLILVANRYVGGRVRWEGWALVRAALASVLAGLAAWAPQLVLGPLPALLAGLVLGPLVLALLARPLRVLADEDARWLADIDVVAGLPGRVARRLVR